MLTNHSIFEFAVRNRIRDSENYFKIEEWHWRRNINPNQTGIKRAYDPDNNISGKNTPNLDSGIHVCTKSVLQFRYFPRVERSWIKI